MCAKCTKSRGPSNTGGNAALANLKALQSKKGLAPVATVRKVTTKAKAKVAARE